MFKRTYRSEQNDVPSILISKYQIGSSDVVQLSSEVALPPEQFRDAVSNYSTSPKN